MEAVDVLIGREDIIAQAGDALQKEKDRAHKLRAVALVGIDGVGKATVSNAVVRRSRFKGVRRVHWTKPVGRDEVDVVFNESAPGHLVVIDGLFWCFSSSKHGFETLRYFARRVAEDAGQRAWLVHADLLFWRYACTVAPLKEAFPATLELTPLDEPALQTAVLARHRLSGYGHAFVTPESELDLSRFIKRSSPFDHYFQRLHKASGGLVRDALRLWLASIEDIKADELVTVGEIPANGFHEIVGLPERTIRALVLVARQGWIDAKTLAFVEQLPVGDAAAQLQSLAHWGILFEKEGVFRVRVHLRGTLYRVLVARGWA